jgi:hypothetical protein
VMSRKRWASPAAADSNAAELAQRLRDITE